MRLSQERQTAAHSKRIRLNRVLFPSLRIRYRFLLVATVSSSNDVETGPPGSPLSSFPAVPCRLSALDL